MSHHPCLKVTHRQRGATVHGTLCWDDIGVRGGRRGNGHGCLSVQSPAKHQLHTELPGADEHLKCRQPKSCTGESIGPVQRTAASSLILST